MPEFHLAYETWGQLNGDASNAVLIEHAMTGDSHVAGHAGDGHPTAGWWNGIVGPGLAVDTTKYFVVVPNILGGCQGSTGPASIARDGRPWGSRFPSITIRDTVQAEVRLAEALGIRRWAAVIGGSMGGMRALEWAVAHPDKVARLLLLACSAATTAEQIAQGALQLAAVTGDAGWHGGDYYDAPAGHGPHRGLSLARRIAQLSYRCEAELAQRFGRQANERENPLEGGRFAVESYLDHHANKLLRRFDAGSYVTLTRAKNTHDVGRGRGGTDAALAHITATTIVASITSDRLYLPSTVQALADGVSGCDGVSSIVSRHGHDGFLIETAQVAVLVRRLLDG
ncbi:homoserine O-acetyltransferase [Amycolatopsis sp. EV170708-02-1]|nr:homoserine O-acetyltransferase [Amycolatopsis sp. EV170708-02-1]UMP06936.1 homoserine O-acetyltransferase [Amycolatopsis sp. EV170708-02-1]